MKQYLVTGASGFVGSCMVDYLLAKNCSVRALVRNPKNASILKSKGVEVVIGDLKDQDSLKSAVQNIYGIFHIGAVFREAKLPDQEYFNVNVEGTRNLFQHAINAKVSRIIYCSTNGVHGDIKNPPANEDTPFAPCDVYQESKVQAEKVVSEFYASGKISGIILRPAMIYGAKDTRLGKIFKMINRGYFFYVGHGQALCHFIEVNDLVNAFWLAMEKTQINNRAYLIAGSKIITLKDFCNLVADILKVKRPWLHLPLIPMQLLADLCELICKPLGIEPPLYRRRVDFYIKNRAFDTSRALKELEFKPKLDFQEELEQVLLEWQLLNSKTFT